MKFFTLIAILATTTPTWAAVQFTAAEKAAHALQIDVITQAAADCLDARWDDHVQFFNKNKVSRYYGNRRYSLQPGKFRADGKPLTYIRDALDANKKSRSLMDTMVSSSCIDLASACMKRGFAAAGQEELWTRISKDSVKMGSLGHVLLIGLQQLGWKMLYWTPAGSKSEAAAFDKYDMDNKADPKARGENLAHWNSVMKSNTYWKDPRGAYNIIVDDKSTLVGFGSNPPAKFMKIPLFLAIAHTGYHVFAGYSGNVIEGHSTRSLFALDNLENNPFNPLGGGAPMSTGSEFYRNGVVMVPPGSL